MISNAVLKDNNAIEIDSFQKSLGQTMILAALVFLSALIIGIPLLCLLSTIAFLLPSLGTLPFTASILLLICVLLPLIFSGHGIFFENMQAIQSIKTSARMVRRLMTPVGLFLMVIIMIGYGLNSLWATPHTNSWMLLVGIFGHGFISSGLLAASFAWEADHLATHRGTGSMAHHSEIAPMIGGPLGRCKPMSGTCSLGGGAWPRGARTDRKRPVPGSIFEVIQQDRRAGASGAVLAPRHG